MPWLTIFNEAFFIFWLSAVIVLLWRHAAGGGARVQRLNTLLNENTARSVETARIASDAALEATHAARVAADAAMRAVTLLEEEQRTNKGDDHA